MPCFIYTIPAPGGQAVKFPSGNFTYAKMLCIIILKFYYNYYGLGN